MILLGLGWVFQACNDGKTYAEMKEEEREAIQRFIEVNDIKVISEDQFAEQDSLTNLDKNEYVLFEESGIYMQVIERGNGKVLEDGRHEILARYLEEQINMDGTSDTLTLNTISSAFPHPDEFMLTKMDNELTATFTYGGAMYNSYNSLAVPAGWLLPFNYIKAGREISGRAKIKLIVPHSKGTSSASQRVRACFYEITYQLSR